jgi:hypothetical protein
MAGYRINLTFTFTGSPLLGYTQTTLKDSPDWLKNTCRPALKHIQTASKAHPDHPKAHPDRL